MNSPDCGLVPRANSFDLLRLVAALMVLFSHHFALFGLPEPAVSLISGSIGSTGVCIFFGISGYLNSNSLMRRRDIKAFLQARALRIYPALIVCVMLTVIMGAIITTDPSRYYGLKTLRYLVQNSTLLGMATRLPGVFEGNIYPDAVNNSIWTLPMELTCYIGLAMIVWAARFKPIATLIALLGVAAALLLFTAFVRGLTEDWLLKLDYAPRYYGIGFLGGALLAIAERVWSINVARLLILAVAGMFALAGQTLTAYLIILPAILVFIGGLKSTRWARPPIDISYGAYLYAFPIQQLIASYRLPFWESFALSLSGAVAFGIASALLVEKPALLWGKRAAADSSAAQAAPAG